VSGGVPEANVIGNLNPAERQKATDNFEVEFDGSGGDGE
jgi:hypothetical protein